jgi:hypothetical protein
MSVKLTREALRRGCSGQWGFAPGSEEPQSGKHNSKREFFGDEAKRACACGKMTLDT